jgi:hypothetical protein
MRIAAHCSIERRVVMAFNNVGPVTGLNPGQSAFWSYSYGGDMGTQMATADVKIPSFGPPHRAFDQKKEKFNDGTTVYFVTITNEGPGLCFHNLQGGGMS